MTKLSKSVVEQLEISLKTGNVVWFPFVEAKVQLIVLPYLQAATDDHHIRRYEMIVQGMDGKRISTNFDNVTIEYKLGSLEGLDELEQQFSFCIELCKAALENIYFEPKNN